MGPGVPKFHAWGHVEGNALYGGNIATVFAHRIGFTIVALAGAGVLTFLASLVLPWWASAIVFFAVLAGLLGRTRTYGAWSGPCPHCGNDAFVSAKRHQQAAFGCQVCNRRILLKGQRFVAIP